MSYPTCKTRRARLALLALIGIVLALPLAAAASDSVYFLVRHAEKADDGHDPSLSPAGEFRARELADLLRDAGIDRVHSSDFIRTRDTAAPIAERLGLVTELYDPGHLPVLAERLQSSPGRHLVIGHSNTTPRLAELLGGDPGVPIDEEHEYDRLYVLKRGGDGAVITVLLRYGTP